MAQAASRNFTELAILRTISGAAEVSLSFTWNIPNGVSID
jgi:hypothetical protein